MRGLVRKQRSFFICLMAFILICPNICSAQWVIETVESSSDNEVVATSIATDSNGYPHISYITYNINDGSKKVKYAHFDGAWHTETVYSLGAVNYTSIAIDSNDKPHISFREWQSGTLRYAYYDNGWHKEIVDEPSGPHEKVGMGASLALDINDRPHISYGTWFEYPNNPVSLRYAYFDGIWNKEIVELSQSPQYFSGTSIALDTDGCPHISYYKDGHPKYAYYNGTWNIEIIAAYDISSQTSLALDSNNKPHITYHKPEGSIYAYYNDAWYEEVIDIGSSGGHVSLALDSNENLHVSNWNTFNSEDNLHYAYNSGGGWFIETVDNTLGNVGEYSSIDIDNLGNVHIGYSFREYGEQNHELKYAKLILTDEDEDGIYGRYDNCLNEYNPSQEDVDEDDVGNVCDNCLAVYNSNQEDTDVDGIGNVCDNCPQDHNPNQEDIDGDGVGNTCDECTDTDSDGYGNPGFPCNTCVEDNCPNDANPGQEDGDNDGVGDACDNCPNDHNPNQEDEDSDEIGNACDTCPNDSNQDQQDTDSDDVGDVCDNCPDDYNPNQEDADGDDIGDVCDATPTSSSTTSSSYPQPPPTTTSTETTSSSTSTSPATTTEPTTTTSTEECSISIEPQTEEVVSRQSLTFTVNATGDCDDSDYEWSVDSNIRSSCNQSGEYTAGINFNKLNPATDIVSVVDHGNGDITAEATITVLFGCPLMQIYGENSEEVEVLRKFRDNVLSKTPEGQELIKLYYQWSPAIMRAMEEDEEFKEEVKEMIDGVLPLITEEAE